MSLTGHEKIGRVGQGCYEDPRVDVGRVSKYPREDATRNMLP